MDEWRRYAAPAAFLLLATVAVLLVRSGLEHGGSAPAPSAPTVASHTHTQPVTTTTAATPTVQTPATRFWTVRAGDTFQVISLKTGVPVATIEQLNPNVKSTSLHIGERLRIR